jgi:hypothetical protein
MFNLECNGCLWPSGAKTQDGKLWFPTQDGAAVVDRAIITTNPQPPPGLSLIKALGATSIAGIPTTPGTYNFTLSAVRSGPTCVPTRSYTLVVAGTVIPLLDCLVRNPNRTYTAKFGYENTTGAVRTIPIGLNNYFTPGKKNLGQATDFQPGRVKNAFSVTFAANGGNLGVWLLRGPDNVLPPVNVTTANVGSQ